MLKFDHLPFGVADADAIRAQFGCLGFTATTTGVCRWTLEGRSHAARATSVVFERGYLDMIEIREPGWEQHLRTSRVYEKGVAPSGVVLGSASLEESRARLSSRGIGVGESYEITRELPGAYPSEIRYQIFSLRDKSLPFSFIEDSAPEAMRTEHWLRHANSATGVRCFHLRVPSLRTWLCLAASVFSGGAASAVTAAFDLGAATLVVHEEPRDHYLAAVSTLLWRRDRPALLAIEFAVVDMDAPRELLDRGRIPSVGLDGGIAIEPSAGYGCGIIFTDAGRLTRCCS